MRWELILIYIIDYLEPTRAHQHTNNHLYLAKVAKSAVFAGVVAAFVAPIVAELKKRHQHICFL